MSCIGRSAETDSLLNGLQDQLQVAEEAGRKIESEGRDQFDKLKAEVEGWLDAAYVEEKMKVVSVPNQSW